MQRPTEKSRQAGDAVWRVVVPDSRARAAPVTAMGNGAGEDLGATGGTEGFVKAATVPGKGGESSPATGGNFWKFSMLTGLSRRLALLVLLSLEELRRRRLLDFRLRCLLLLLLFLLRSDVFLRFFSGLGLEELELLSNFIFTLLER